jgi:DNA anti-recombination protein RmuC
LTRALRGSSKAQGTWGEWILEKVLEASGLHKFVGFVEDMNSLGQRLKQAQSDYDDAYGKLSTSRGNLVGQAQKLRQLGVKPSKSLAPALVDGAYESDELPFVLESDATSTPKTTANGRALGDIM